MVSDRPFRAFVSYSHADAAFAAWLQRRLEAYRLPRRLAGQVEPLPGQAPGRIGPVFRDRADLSAATDLSAAVREGIAASSALVVVASPDASKSQWVEREIALFRQLHPEAPILVALARGEPREGLPAGLRGDGVEPLCADFRREGDGKRLAFLKIVAGLAGLPLDALVQRDAQRQVRRVTGVTLGAAVLVVIMALLLVMALRARGEAERRRVEAEQQRASAEGLVEYMLTDLRERLRGVGRLDVMASVNARAMAYYSSQGDLSRLPDDSLERHARVLHAMGEDDEKQGDLRGALAKFQEAHRATAATLARHPEDGDAVYAHAQSEYWIGYAAWRQRDRATATRHWRRYREQAGRLAALERGSARGHLELGYSEGNLCDLDFSEGHDLAAAARHCLAGVAHVRSALARSPGDRKLLQDLANRYGWLARVRVAQKRYADAIASRRSEMAILDRLLHLDPDNAEYGLRRSWPDVGIARILIETGRPAEAVALLKRRWEAFRPRMTAEKSNQYWESGLRVALFLAKAQRLAGLEAHRTTDREAGAAIGRYLELFPDRGPQIRALIADIG
jgi:hypothetical protein